MVVWWEGRQDLASGSRGDRGKRVDEGRWQRQQTEAQGCADHGGRHESTLQFRRGELIDVRTEADERGAASRSDMRVDRQPKCEECG